MPNNSPPRDQDPFEFTQPENTPDNDNLNNQLTEEDLNDRKERRAFRKKIFDWATWLGIFLLLCWLISGIISTLGILSFEVNFHGFYFKTATEKTAKYLLIEFGIISSFLLAMFMAIINLSKEKNNKEEDKPLLIEIGNHTKDILLAFIKSRTGHH